MECAQLKKKHRDNFAFTFSFYHHFFIPVSQSKMKITYMDLYFS
jgi:hypothetical protein